MTIPSSTSSIAGVGTPSDTTTMVSSIKSAARLALCALTLLFVLLAAGLPAQAANNAAFAGQSVPTAMVTGGTYTATVIMINNGTTTWSAGALYRLGAQNPQDNFTWMSGNRVALAGAVAPGQSATFVFQVFKWGEGTTTAANGWKEGDFMLHLPNQGSVQANCAQNAGRLREQMGQGAPIFDSYRNVITGARIDTGGFLGAERNLLESRGWQYNPSTGAYHPPGP